MSRIPLIYPLAARRERDLLEASWLAPKIRKPRAWTSAVRSNLPAVLFLAMACVLLCSHTALADGFPAPRISGMSPVTAAPGGADLTLTVNGSNFASVSLVYWNSTALATT
jgi:hypothetical protein